MCIWTGKASASGNQDEKDNFPTPAMNAEPVVVGFIDFAPSSYMDADGEAKGASIEYARTLLKEAGLKHRFIMAPISRLYSRLERGEVHVSIATNENQKIKQFTMYCPEPIAALKINLYGRQQDKPPHITDLSDTTIITLQGYLYSGLLQQIAELTDVKTISTPTREAAYMMLYANRGRYLLDYEVPSREITQRLQLTGLEATTLSSIDQYVVVSKNAPHANRLHQRLTDAIQRVPKTAFQEPAATD